MTAKSRPSKADFRCAMGHFATGVTVMTSKGALLRELDGEKRELLAMRFAASLSSREIAAVIGKNEAAVKKQLGRILRTLQEKYGEY